MHPDGNGGVYAESEKIRLMAVFPPGVEQISRTMCATIAGIIAHWASDFLCCYQVLVLTNLQIDHSNEEIGDDDWFTVDWK
jgi:hypothetical protein